MYKILKSTNNTFNGLTFEELTIACIEKKTNKNFSSSKILEQNNMYVLSNEHITLYFIEVK